MKKLRDIMRPGFVFTVPRHATVAEATRLMVAENIGIVSVVDGDRLIGVFSERDVTRRVVAAGLEPAGVRVGDVMTKNLVVADADEDYQAAMSQDGPGEHPAPAGGERRPTPLHAFHP